MYQNESRTSDVNLPHRDRKVLSFRGELSTESKKYLNKKQSNAGIVVALIMIVIFALPSVAALFFDNPEWIWPLFILGCGIIGGVLFWLMMCFVKWYPDQIDIENGIIYLINDSGKFNVSKEIDSVVKVIDEGNFYYLKFRGGRFPFGLCQKDLLVKGTIEDFEKVFDGLIVRK